MTPWDQVNEEFACEHAELVVCKKTSRDGRSIYYRQCTRCGHGIVIKKIEAQIACGCGAIPDFDQKAADDWWNRKSERQKELQRVAAEQQSAEWWDAYNEYMHSDKWRAKSQAVLNRDNHICQACLRNRATQAHHLTYKHFMEEPLFELIAVCVPCHRKITALDRAGRKTA